MILTRLTKSNMSEIAFIPLILHAFIMAATPGPNNVLLMASGLVFGFKRTWPHLLGIPAGLVLQLWLTGSGLGLVFIVEPRFQIMLKIAGSLYMLWLAVCVWKSSDIRRQDAGNPIRFWQAVSFQFVNPKAWLISATAVSAFLPSGEGYVSRLSIVSLIYALVGLPCMAVWVIFGATFRPWLQDRRIARGIHRSMAAITAFSVFLLWA